MVRQGYKQTEVGVIPEDWQISAMEALTSLMTNGFVGTIKSEYVPSGTGILYLQGFNIKENGFDLTGVTYVSDAFHKQHLKSELKENDLLTVQTGDIGVTSYLPKQFEGANCQALIISRFYEKYDSRFWSYYFNSIGRKALKLIETGTTMKHINVGDMKGVLVPVPTNKTEQTRIADALSDVDNMISSVEKLIVKKKAIKQGAMQELLTEKKRLPGFTGEWIKVQLKDIFDFYKGNGLSKEKVSDNGKNACILYGELFTRYTEVIGNITNKTNSDEGLRSCKFDVLMPGSTTTNGLDLATASVIMDNDVLLGGDIVVLRPKKEMDTRIFGYLLRTMPKEILQHTQGITIVHLNTKTFREMEVLIPKTVEEQTAIADILADMDNEIEALEQKLTKTRQIKQGMMQQLLTGKIRLV